MVKRTRLVFNIKRIVCKEIVVKMCRMNILLGIGENKIPSSLIENQIEHIQQMANGASGIKFGDLTSSKNYNLGEIVRHKDGFGGYVEGRSFYHQKYHEPIYRFPKADLLEQITGDAKVSFWHARLTTQGSKNLTNNQPINLRNIVGTHNGTVYGLESGGISDSNNILSIIDRFFDDKDSLDIEQFEDLLVDQVARKSVGYSGLVLFVYVKSIDKLLVLCEYNEQGVPKGGSVNAYNNYYTPAIVKNQKHIYVSSELGDFIEGEVTYTQNHTLYVIDRKTGEIVEYRLDKLKTALNEAGKRKVKDVDERDLGYIDVEEITQPINEMYSDESIEAIDQECEEVGEDEFIDVVDHEYDEVYVQECIESEVESEVQANE